MPEGHRRVVRKVCSSGSHEKYFAPSMAGPPPLPNEFPTTPFERELSAPCSADTSRGARSAVALTVSKIPSAPDSSYRLYSCSVAKPLFPSECIVISSGSALVVHKPRTNSASQLSLRVRVVRGL